MMEDRKDDEPGFVRVYVDDLCQISPSCNKAVGEKLDRLTRTDPEFQGVQFVTVPYNAAISLAGRTARAEVIQYLKRLEFMPRDEEDQTEKMPTGVHKVTAYADGFGGVHSTEEGAQEARIKHQFKELEEYLEKHAEMGQIPVDTAVRAFRQYIACNPDLFRELLKED